MVNVVNPTVKTDIDRWTAQICVDNIGRPVTWQNQNSA